MARIKLKATVKYAQGHSAITGETFLSFLKQRERERRQHKIKTHTESWKYIKREEDTEPYAQQKPGVFGYKQDT